MKKAKKIIPALLFVAMLVLSLGACGNASSSVETDGANSGDIESKPVFAGNGEPADEKLGEFVVGADVKIQLGPKADYTFSSTDKPAWLAPVEVGETGFLEGRIPLDEELGELSFVVNATDKVSGAVQTIKIVLIVIPVTYWNDDLQDDGVAYNDYNFAYNFVTKLVAETGDAIVKAEGDLANGDYKVTVIDAEKLAAWTAHEEQLMLDPVRPGETVFDGAHAADPLRTAEEAYYLDNVVFDGVETWTPLLEKEESANEAAERFDPRRGGSVSDWDEVANRIVELNENSIINGDKLGEFVELGTYEWSYYTLPRSLSQSGFPEAVKSKGFNTNGIAWVRSFDINGDGKVDATARNRLECGLQPVGDILKKPDPKVPDVPGDPPPGGGTTITPKVIAESSAERNSSVGGGNHVSDGGSTAGSGSLEPQPADQPVRQDPAPPADVITPAPAADQSNSTESQPAVQEPTQPPPPEPNAPPVQNPVTGTAPE